MHVTLINPAVQKLSFDSTCAQLPPLGQLYIAAYLEEKGHTVTIIDAELYSLAPDEVVQRIPEHTQLIGLGGTTFQATEAFAIATLVRNAQPGCSIIYGGPHACALQYEIFKQCQAIDHVILGPGEIPVVAFANGDAPQSILGCLSREDIPLASPEFAKPLPFDEQPLPARHLVPIRAYTGAGRLPFTQTSMMLTRGCPFKCMFCSSTVWGKIWQKRDVDDIVKEVILLRDMGFTEIFFQDDTINVDVAWAQELFETISARNLGVQFKLAMRVNEKMLPEHLVATMAKAGVKHLFFGVEAANDTIRNTVAKGITKDEVRRAEALAKKYNIRTTLAFIIGLPGETEETVEESIAFVKELCPYEAGFSVAIPFPGSALRTWAIENNLLENTDTSALQYGSAVMRTHALTCGDLEHLRNRAEHETVQYTGRTECSAKEQCNHIIDTLLHLRKYHPDDPAIPFVMLFLARNSLDIPLGHEPGIWNAQRLTGYNLSRFITAKAHALLGNALTLFGQKVGGIEHFYLAESAGIAAISDWCGERYMALGYGEGHLLPNARSAVLPERFDYLRAEECFFDTNTRRCFALDAPIQFTPDQGGFFDAAFHTPDALLTALADARKHPACTLVWLHGIVSLLASEAAISDFFHACKAVSDANTVWIVHDVFGLEASDSLRSETKRSSLRRFCEIANMHGFVDTTSTDGFSLAFSALQNDQTIASSQVLCLRQMPRTSTAFRAVALGTHERLLKQFAAEPWQPPQKAYTALKELLADARYDLLLRYDCAISFGMEDALYAESRTVDYGSFGQWQMDYADMLGQALDMRGKKLLDFGCASGMHVLGFRLQGIDAWGVDINRTFIAHAPGFLRRYLQAFSPANPEELLTIFGEASFDAIIATEVFEHVPHESKRAYLKIFRQILKPGGLCIITCPTGDQNFENFYGGGVFADPQHRYLCTDAQLSAMFAAENFEDISESYWAGIKRFTGKYGFSFWRTYCSFDIYFCLKKEGTASSVNTNGFRARSIALSMWVIYSLSRDVGAVRWCKRMVKDCARKSAAVGGAFLSPRCKAYLKTTSLGTRLRSYLQR